MRCKMKLDSISRTTWGHSLEFSAVSDGSDKDKAFWRATPSGSIKLAVLNEKAIEGLELGAKYYVDFTLAGP